MVEKLEPPGSSLTRATEALSKLLPGGLREHVVRRLGRLGGLETAPTKDGAGKYNRGRAD